MAVRLIEPAETPEQIREILLSSEEFLIGRGADCNLRLRSSDISRHHCLIRVGKEEVTLNDLGSANGTLVNGQRIRCPTILKSGDELHVGSARFVVDLGDSPGLFEQIEKASDPRCSTQRIRRAYQKNDDNSDKA